MLDNSCSIFIRGINRCKKKKNDVDECIEMERQESLLICHEQNVSEEPRVGHSWDSPEILSFYSSHSVSFYSVNIPAAFEMVAAAAAAVVVVSMEMDVGSGIQPVEWSITTGGFDSLFSFNLLGVFGSFWSPILVGFVRKFRIVEIG